LVLALPPRSVSFWIAGLAGMFYGISDEFHQAFIPGRCFEIADMVADTAGAFLGAFLFHRYRINTKSFALKLNSSLKEPDKKE
ncbi:MAG: VanZ family protein, partial [Planctomycetota bacterium]